MKKQNHNLEKAALAIPDILEKNKLLTPYKLFQAKRDWKQIVGPKIAQYSYILAFDGSAAIVAVLNSVWMSQMFMYKQKIIEKINEYIHDSVIDDIRFVRRGRRPDYFTYATVSGEEEYSLEMNVKGIVLPEETVRRIQDDVKNIPDALKERIVKLRFIQEKRRLAAMKNNKRQCPNCGRWLDAGESVCYLCRLKERHHKKIDIYRIVTKMPWLTLEEMKHNGYIPKDNPMYTELYNEVKRECIYKCIHRIYCDCEFEEDGMMLAMLITGRHPVEITDEFIRNLTKKYRRKDDVPSCRRPADG